MTFDKYIESHIHVYPNPDIEYFHPHFLGSSVVKNLLAKAGDTGDLGSIPGSGRSSGEENGCPLQYSCLENSSDRRAWWVIVHGITKSWTQLSH